MSPKQRKSSTSSTYSGKVVDPTSLIDNQIRGALRCPASPPTLHPYILNSRGNDYSYIIVKSHALNAQDTPLLYYGDGIPVYVILSPSDLRDMQKMDVVLHVFDLDPIIPRLKVKSSQRVDKSGGKICWPFTIAPPMDSIASSSSSLKFELIVTIYRRWRLTGTRNVGVKQELFYVPRPDPSLRLRSSPDPILLSFPDVAPTPAPSMPSWLPQKFPAVIVRGVIFDRVNVEVVCELITPIEYPASDSIPLRLVLTSESYEAIDLFSMPHANDVRLQKVLAFGKRAGAVRPLTLKDRDSFHRAELAATANWERDGDIKALPPDEHHRRPRWRVKLNGALQRIQGVELKPSYEEPGVTMANVYFVSFFSFRAAEFRPENNPKKELVMGKIKLT